MAVHRRLGAGFLEAVYADALEVEFQRQGVPCQREVPFTISYEGQPLKAQYHADFVCYGEVLVELKAQPGTGLPETAQVVDYLRVSGLETGLLLNFGLGSLEYRRHVFTHRLATKSAELRSMTAWRPSPGPSPPSKDSVESAASAGPREALNP